MCDERYPCLDSGSFAWAAIQTSTDRVRCGCCNAYLTATENGRLPKHGTARGRREEVKRLQFGPEEDQ